MKQQLLEALDKRIAKLQELRAFTAGEDFGESANHAAPPRKAKVGPKNTAKQPPSIGTQAEKMHEWLRKHQGSTRAEIMAGTGIPAGTVSVYLTEKKDLFEKREEKWYAL
jgi:hypothetical protein